MENNFGKNLKYLREKNNILQGKMAKELKIDQSTIAKWETGDREPNMGMIIKVSNYFNVHIHSLITDDIKMNDFNKNAESILNGVKIPVLGKIPAGIPLEAIRDIIDYEDIPSEWLVGGKEYFALKISGDSMIPGYNDGDTVIFQKSEDCESGSCCAVMVNGHDATFKKIIKQDNGIILMPLNANYEPQMFTNNDVELLPIRILGIAREIRRKV